MEVEVVVLEPQPTWFDLSSKQVLEEEKEKAQFYPYHFSKGL